MLIFEAVLLSLTAWTGLIVIIGTIMSIVYRNKPIVKSTVPYVNIPIDLVYMGMVGFCAQQAIEQKTPCIVYLWLPFIFTFALGNSYVIKCVRLYVLATTGKLKTMEFNASKHYAPVIPESLEDQIMIELSINDPLPSEIPSVKTKTSRLEDWIFENSWIGRMSFLWKVFAVATAIEMVVPMVINLTIEQYKHPLDQCSDRTAPEIAIFMSIIVFYVVIYVVTIVKMWKCKDYFGLRKQLFMSAISWTIVLLVFVGIFAAQQHPRTKENANMALSAFAVICWLIPFSSDTLWPLFRTHLNSELLRSKDLSGYKLGIEEIIQWQGFGRSDVGWEALAAYVNEHMSPADAKNNMFLLHGLYFIREYILKRNELTQYHGTDLLMNRNSRFDKELCAIVVLAWMKYLHKKGELVWKGQPDLEALFMIEFRETETLRKELESALATLVNADYYYLLSEDQQTKAGRKLRDLYKKIVTKAESEILEGFKKSIQFEHFIRSVKGEISTIK